MSRFFIKNYANYVIVCCGCNFHYTENSLIKRYQSKGKHMLYLSEYSTGSVYYRTNNLTTILHLVSVIVMLSLFLACNKILLKLIPYKSSRFALSYCMVFSIFHVILFFAKKIHFSKPTGDCRKAELLKEKGIFCPKVLDVF
jgi:hypothetical protein